MRVAHVINSLAMGGAERFLVELLTEPGYRSRVRPELVLLNRDGERFYEEYDLDLPVVQLDFPGRWRELGPARACIRRIQERIRDVDLVHTHLWVPDLYGAIACRRVGRPHVSHVHNTLDWMTSTRPGFRVRRWLYRRAFRRASTTFLACSARAAEYQREHLRLPADRFTVVPYGIDGSRFDAGDRTAPCRPNPVRVGMAGRFVRWKGHHELLEALGRLEPSVRDRLEVVVAGDGPERSAVLQSAADGNLGNVSFPGRVRDMPTFYRGLDALVQPSLSSEGLPLTILEALAAGCAVVASDVAGAAEAVTDGENGFLVPPGDVSALASALERLTQLPEEAWLRLSGSARRSASRFDRAAVARRIVEHYEAVLRAPLG